MARQLDHEARDRAVVEAAWRVISREGMTALTVRSVAKEAGLAPSSLRYSFPTQSTVRERAISAVLERLQERVTALPRDGAWGESALLELIPVDDEKHTEAVVWLALEMAAVADVELQPVRARANAYIRAVCHDVAAWLGSDSDDFVDQLHAFVDGLTLHVVVRDECTPAWARRALSIYLNEARQRLEAPGASRG
ncbi:TetR/AcrR family transcriptional regulator [Leucobacter albus]|uniref:TetR/AcrR family transcriptional regulator n=1 Tax=Leucobacter albus TaxID=272210 RepID=A0ABW3TNS8_9MICO